jgi:hypothetical protein
MFATVIIVLPSTFTGGTAHLSHGPLSVVYDCSRDSSFKMTVLSWYTDVMHEIKPITSGYRLALAYNLVHTTNALRPSLGETDDVVNQLKHVLKSWKQADDGPTQLINLLNHKYSQANLRGSALKGLDAQKLGILNLLGEQYGFHLGLASVCCTLSGYAEDYGRGYGRGYGRYDDSEGDGNDVDFAEVEERAMTIENLVDLEGRKLRETLDFDEESEVIPRDLIEDVENGPHDGQDYEGYMGNVSAIEFRLYVSLIDWMQGAGSLSRCEPIFSTLCANILTLCRVPSYSSRHMA